jgi:hypothetical protein
MLLALPFFLSMMSGCEVVLFYYLLDQDDDEWDTVGQIRCEPEGLRADGKLAIPILEPLDEQEAEDICSWWQLSFQTDRYTACCGGDCCEWGVGADLPVTDEELAGPGDWCRWSGMCRPGLTCFPPAPGTVDCATGEVPGPEGCVPLEEGLADSGTCRLGNLGEWCDATHDCEDPMYCTSQEMWGSGECRLHVAVEGGGCIPGDIEPCLPPMRCACPTPKDCKCWDGSVGDPCQQESCQAGLTCQVVVTGGTSGKLSCVDGVVGDPCNGDSCNPTLSCMPVTGEDESGLQCVEGVAGDPCYTSATCMSGLECIQFAGRAQGVCGVFRQQAAPCDPGDRAAPCEQGLVCNTAYPTPVCEKPGTVSEPCARDEECRYELQCAEEVSQCTAGQPGQPCGTTADCLAGSVCMFGQGIMACHAYLKKGDACEKGNPFKPCIPGLVCNGAEGSEQCQPLGKDFTPCTTDVDCLPAYHCLAQEGKCFDGKDSDPCWTDGDCAEGWHCVEGISLCFNGNTWDGCKADADCLDGYQCDLSLQACFAGSHGTKCLSSDECGPGLICLPGSDWGYCFEYLAQGEACGASAPPFTACDLGLVCNDALVPPACAVPGGEGTPCAASKHCAAGLVCDATLEPPACAPPTQ